MPVALTIDISRLGDRDGDMAETGQAHQNPLCFVGRSHLDIDLSLHMFPLVFLSIAPRLCSF